MGLRVDQPFCRQAHQRLADGREPEGETVLQVGSGQPLSRHQVAMDDLGSEPDIGPFGVGAATFQFHRYRSFHVDMGFYKIILIS